MAKSEVELHLEKKVKSLTKEIEAKTVELKEAQAKLDEFGTFKEKFDYYNSILATAPAKQVRQKRTPKADVVSAKTK